MIYFCNLSDAYYNRHNLSLKLKVIRYLICLCKKWSKECTLINNKNI